MITRPMQENQEREERRGLLLEAAAKAFGKSQDADAALIPPGTEDRRDRPPEGHARRAGGPPWAQAQADIPARDQLRSLTLDLVQHFHDQPLVSPGLGGGFIPVIADCREQLRGILVQLAETGLIRLQSPEFLADLFGGILQACLHDQYRQAARADGILVCVDRALECYFQGVGERP